MRIRRAAVSVLSALTLSAATLLVAGAGPASASAEGSGSPAVPRADQLASLQLTWSLKPTGSTARFRGLAPVSRSVAWASGTEGTVLRTTDGGATWASVGPPDTETLQFRDIEATSADHAVIMSIGNGTDSRIYVTDNGGRSWTETFRNTDDAAFYDCMAFSSPRKGLALSDPVDGKFRLIETSDAGRSWSLVDPAGMPAARDGEFAFAASGTCLTAGQGSSVYIASGGTNPGRVFTSHDRGHTWTVADTPVAGSASAGIFSVQFEDRRTGIAVGGDYLNPTGAANNAAYSTNGGKTWTPSTSFPTGYRSGSSWVPYLSTVALAVGPTGSDLTIDGGRTWHGFDTGSFDSVECTPDLACWASGEQGRIAVLGLTW